MLKKFTPFIIILLAILTAGFAIFGENNYQSILVLRNSLEQQKVKNTDLSDKVENLKRDVYGLRNDDREVEKVAREELGMARPNEKIFIFEKDKKTSK